MKSKYRCKVYYLPIPKTKNLWFRITLYPGEDRITVRKVRGTDEEEQTLKMWHGNVALSPDPAESVQEREK